MIDDIINDKAKHTAKANQLRTFLLTLTKSYNEVRNKMDIPLKQEELNNVINNLDIHFEHKVKIKTNDSFQVTHSQMTVIDENFEDSDKRKDNIFLLYYELTRLSNPLNMEIFNNSENLKSQYNKMLASDQTSYISGSDILNGVEAVDNVLAQWCCENCKDFLRKGNAKRVKKLLPFKIMGQDLVASTDFSGNYAYSPLQQYVEDFSTRLDFKNFKTFAKCILTGEIGLNDLVTPETIKQLGCIGILHKGIVCPEDSLKPKIPMALAYLDNLKKAYISQSKTDIKSR